jgi:hypothetical protein
MDEYDLIHIHCNNPSMEGMTNTKAEQWSCRILNFPLKAILSIAYRAEKRSAKGTITIRTERQKIYAFIMTQIVNN